MEIASVNDRLSGAGDKLGAMSSDEPTDPGNPAGGYLVIAGRIPELDAAVAAGDREKAIEILGRAGMTDRVPFAVNALFARPEDYGYPKPPDAAVNDDDDDWEEDEPTRVQFTLTVISDEPIDELQRLLQPSIRPRQPDQAFMYDIHHFNVEDDNWETRGDAVDAGVLKAVDALEATGVGLEKLSPPNAWVRAHFTFTPGAETITAEAVRRLAAYNSVLWIDVLGG